MSYTKSVVCDFDDCLSFTLNRDWENATCNVELAGKLNQLIDDGWEVHIITARGQLSCNGDCDAADKKYRAQIESWLNKHGIKYTTLSFQKKLASYYIDDKAIRPEEFIQKNVELIRTGMSGAEVMHDDRYVHKTANNTQNVVLWYNMAQRYGFNVPGIHKVIGNTMTMDYIDGITYENHMKACEPNFTAVLDLCKTFNGFPPMNNASFDSYIDRIGTHYENSKLRINGIDRYIVKLSNSANRIPATFNHGDLSIDNIILKDRKLFLIDPIYEPTLYSSYMIDLAKFVMSLNRFKLTDDYTRFYINGGICGMDTDTIRLLEISHWIRFYKYTNNREEVAHQISTLITNYV